MAQLSSESLILRTWPLRESDLLVSFFTRDFGKLRGVANRARKAKTGFGPSLERLAHARVQFVQRETRELVTLRGCDILQSNFATSADYKTSVAMDFIAEAADLLLPAHEVNERIFRLMLAVLEYLRGAVPGGHWIAATYFSLWAVKLSGFLPHLHLTDESHTIAMEMLATPIAKLALREWTKETAQDLRRSLIHEIETHAERHLNSAPILESL